MSTIKTKLTGIIAVVGLTSIEITADSIIFSNEAAEQISAHITAQGESIETLTVSIATKTKDAADALALVSTKETEIATLTAEVARLNEIVARNPATTEKIKGDGSEGSDAKKFDGTKSAGFEQAMKDIHTRL